MKTIAELTIEGKLREGENGNNEAELKVLAAGSQEGLVAMLVEVFEKSPGIFNACHVAVHYFAEMKEKEEKNKKNQEEAKTFTITLPKIETKEDFMKALTDAGKQLANHFEKKWEKLKE